MQQPIGQNDPAVFATAKENQYFDRKSARIKPNDVARHIVAFANAAGGKLVIGIEDDGEITGFRRSGSRDIEDFRHAPLACCEPVPVVRAVEVAVTNSRGEDDFILVLDVRPSTDHVIARRGDRAVFLRQGDRSVVLGHDQITALEYDKNQRRFEDEVADRSSIDDVDPEVMARYKKELGTDVPDEQVLRSRGFLVDGHLTNAGVLIFAENPTRFIPCARVRVIRFDGNKMQTGRRLNIVKERTFDGPLPKEFAWFEGLVNAVTHRNYAHSGDHIRVMMYDDRMEILSPGKLPNVVTLENMRHTRWARNPIIARTLAEFGWVRELNEGVQRIYDEMAGFFLNEPIFEEPNDASVQLTLENSITSRVLRREDALTDSIGQAAYEALNEYELAAMQYVFARGRVTVSELKEHLGRSVKVVRPTLRGLVDKGLLDWHGSNSRDPSQYYDLHR